MAHSDRHQSDRGAQDEIGARIPRAGFFNSVTGDKKSTPQTQAVEAIEKGLATATGTIEEGIGTAREDLQPFTEAGTDALGGVQRNLADVESLITDPNAQKDFVQDNPFFKVLADDAKRRIFGNAAARGRVGSGGTAKALQDSLLLLGNDLVGQNVNQRFGVADRNFNLADLGLRGAGGQATATASGALTLADIASRGGETVAAGILGEEATKRSDKAASSGRTSDFINTGISAIGLALSDRRFKTDITYLDKVNGVPFYLFKYKGSDKVEFGTMAQDVEHIPGAVIEIAGVKHVDYARL